MFLNVGGNYYMEFDKAFTKTVDHYNSKTKQGGVVEWLLVVQGFCPLVILKTLFEWIYYACTCYTNAGSWRVFCY